MNRTYIPRLLHIAMLFMLASCQSQVMFAPISTLKPGDTINDIVLGIGTAKTPPLWAFCSAQDGDHVKTSDCRIPPTISKVAIGHIFGIVDDALTKSDWSEFTWILLVDEQIIDLPAFGTYSFVLPTLSNSSSSIREVFIKVTAWDVVLMDLRPGTHTLRGSAQSKTETYNWVANIVIEAP
jgi:hypothetical protein